jgi:hypothetical protein
MRLTDAGNHDDMPILPFPHYWQDGLDDVDVGEEVDLEDFVNQTYSATALCQLFHSADYSLNRCHSARM